MAVPPASPQSSTFPRLGRYELVANIASGGMGSVVLARLPGAGGFQRLFAIKVLHRHYAQDDEFLELLLDEARIAARIHHANVVGIQEVAESPEHGYYLVMDYVEGVPLSDVLERTARGPARERWRLTLRILLDGLQGLHAAHALTDDRGLPLDVVHRDFSPQNVLVGTDGVARVTDFGIAKAAARIAHTSVGRVRGKVAYMSPEQARGDRIDARSDVFAAGIMLWESLLGQRLFKGQNDQDSYARVLRLAVPSPRQQFPELPAELEAVVQRALERSVDARFASAREMALALERAARAHDLLADAHEVGEWLARAFAAKLEERRAQVRKTAKDTLLGDEGMLLPARAPAAVDPDEDAATDIMRDQSARRRAVAPNHEFDDVKDTMVDDDLDHLPTSQLMTDVASDELKAAMAAYRAQIAGAGAAKAAGPPLAAPGGSPARSGAVATPAGPRSAASRRARSAAFVVLALVLAVGAVALGMGLAHWQAARAERNAAAGTPAP